MRFLRALRGMLGTALAWAVAWVPLGLAVTVVWVVIDGWSLEDVWTWLPGLAPWFALWGGISGAGFAVLLGLAEARGSVATLKLSRVGIWGAIGAGLLTRVMPLVANGFDASLITTAIGAGLGALCASGSVVIARRPLLPSDKTPSLPPAPGRIMESRQE